MGKIRWGRLFRRGLAFCVAALTVWALCWGVGAGAGTGTAQALGSSGAFVTAALRTELGDRRESGLPLLLRLAVGQSSLLRANLENEEPLPLAGEPSPEPLPDAQPAPDHDDVTEEPPETTAAPEDIVERTLVPSVGGGYVTGAGLYLYNRTDKKVDLEAAAGQALSFTLAPAEEGPQILIIHSHATEAYTPDGTDVYVPSDNSRTLDEKNNMLRVGDEMAEVFTSMGLSVIHDRGLYDYPRYAGSYGRSGPAVEEYLERYPTIKVVLDVHRDALVGSDGTVYKAVTTVDGAKTAQVMLVIGTDDGGGDHPDWRENLALAARLQKSADTLYPTLARPMTLRSSAYNQNLSAGSLLVEVGSHGNTLQEALAGARDFARSAGAVFLSLVEKG